MEVIFPDRECYLKASKAKRYYQVFYKFLLNSLRHAGASIQFTDCTSIGIHKFTMIIDGRTILIDYSDTKEVDENLLNYQYYFKFHYNNDLHKNYDNVFPLSPVSFYDWDQFEQVKSSICYEAKGDLIINRQRPYGNARERRKDVQASLIKAYGNQVKTKVIDQLSFWKEINRALVGVFVPGQRIDILDKAQIQYMAFGACTISPKLSDTFPYFRDLIPGYHYFQCKPDFSDLKNLIHWCTQNREACREIGENVKRVFLTTARPEKKWQWVQSIIES